MAENYDSHFAVSSAESHTKCEAVKTEPVSKLVLELQQKTEKIILSSVSALSLSLSLSLSLLTTFYFSLSS